MNRRPPLDPAICALIEQIASCVLDEFEEELEQEMAAQRNIAPQAADSSDPRPNRGPDFAEGGR